MIGKPVNLNRFRKQKARAEKSARAEENAVKFGRTKERRRLEDSERGKARRDLESHRRDE